MQQVRALLPGGIHAAVQPWGGKAHGCAHTQCHSLWAVASPVGCAPGSGGGEYGTAEGGGAEGAEACEARPPRAGWGRAHMHA